MNAVQEMIATTNQSDLGLTLDLHMNQLGAGALMQVTFLFATDTGVMLLSTSFIKASSSVHLLCSLVVESTQKGIINSFASTI